MVIVQWYLWQPGTPIIDLSSRDFFVFFFFFVKDVTNEAKIKIQVKKQRKTQVLNLNPHK